MSSTTELTQAPHRLLRPSRFWTGPGCPNRPCIRAFRPEPSRNRSSLGRRFGGWNHEYEAWADAPFSIDTALVSPVQAVSIVTQHLIAGRG